MKFYRLTRSGNGFFLSPDEEDIKYEADYRNKENGDGKWSYKEIEVDDRAVGICWNNFPRLKTPSGIVTTGSPMCSVGITRMERVGDRARQDDLFFDETNQHLSLFGGCSECPYFISQKELAEIVQTHYVDEVIYDSEI